MFSDFKFIIIYIRHCNKEISLQNLFFNNINLLFDTITYHHRNLKIQLTNYYMTLYAMTYSRGTVKGLKIKCYSILKTYY